jgi:hypothetical protein
VEDAVEALRQQGVQRGPVDGVNRLDDGDLVVPGVEAQDR